MFCVGTSGKRGLSDPFSFNRPSLQLSAAERVGAEKINQSSLERSVHELEVVSSGLVVMFCFRLFLFGVRPNATGPCFIATPGLPRDPGCGLRLEID